MAVEWSESESVRESASAERTCTSTCESRGGAFGEFPGISGPNQNSYSSSQPPSCRNWRQLARWRKPTLSRTRLPFLPFPTPSLLLPFGPDHPPPPPLVNRWHCIQRRPLRVDPTIHASFSTVYRATGVTKTTKATSGNGNPSSSSPDPPWIRARSKTMRHPPTLLLPHLHPPSPQDTGSRCSTTTSSGRSRLPTRWMAWTSRSPHSRCCAAAPRSAPPRHPIRTLPARRAPCRHPSVPKPITSLYVSGLPLDATSDEIARVFSRYGVLLEDDQGKPRVKMYHDDKTGMFRGEALVVYFKPESVELAINMLDETNMRAAIGQTSSSGPIMRVQRAQFPTESGIGDKVQNRPQMHPPKAHQRAISSDRERRAKAHRVRGSDVISASKTARRSPSE